MCTPKYEIIYAIDVSSFVSHFCPKKKLIFYTTSHGIVSELTNSNTVKTCLNQTLNKTPSRIN